MIRRSRPPSPQDYIPVRFFVQLTFPGFEVQNGWTCDYDFADVLGRAVDSVSHRAGIWVNKIDVEYDGLVFQATAYIEAGEWKRTVVHRTNHVAKVTQGLCAKILRLARREHELLG